MAVTSIWPIKGRVDKVINYARNPEKTHDKEKLSELHEIEGVVEYAADEMKTEKRAYVTCLNLHSEETAAQEFMETKRLMHNEGGRSCYHGYQSFKADEVDADTAHSIGVALARELWGDRFQVVIATHCNTGHYHNHFVVNSVSDVDGKKFYNSPADYRRMREVSDRLCREYGLSVIEKPKEKGEKVTEIINYLMQQPYANNIIENNIIKSYAKVYKCYTPAININGVGNVVSENEIYDAPHNAILLGGQMNLVELNYIHDVCLETSDSGAIYAGGTFSGQGNVIRYNYFENILRNALGYVNNAVYLDNMYSSAKVYGNIFYSCESAALLGGGRANEFYNNIVIDCANSITVDARGTWSDSWKETAQNRVNSLKNEFPYYNQGIWKEKFPHLSNVEEDEPELPKYNKVYNNVYYNSKAENIADSAYLSGTIKKNISLTDKKAFFDFDNKIFVPVKDGEVYQNIPDFVDIPFELIGKTK